MKYFLSNIVAVKKRVIRDTSKLKFNKTIISTFNSFSDHKKQDMKEVHEFSMLRAQMHRSAISNKSYCDLLLSSKQHQICENKKLRNQIVAINKAMLRVKWSFYLKIISFYSMSTDIFTLLHTVKCEKLKQRSLSKFSSKIQRQFHVKIQENVRNKEFQDLTRVRQSSMLFSSNIRERVRIQSKIQVSNLLETYTLGVQFKNKTIRWRTRCNFYLMLRWYHSSFSSKELSKKEESLSGITSFLERNC